MSTPLPQAANDQPSKDFAIIGGGSTGPMLLIYIAQKAREAGASLAGQKIHLIDPKGFCGGGIAYGQCADKHYLNSTRDEMSPWNPNAFHEWCVAKGEANKVLTFNRRADYTPFLQSEFEEAKRTLEALGAEIIEHETEAKPVIQQDKSYKIVGSDGQAILTGLSTDDFALTPGYGPNNNFEQLRPYNGDGYIHSPYDLDAISQISTGAKVAFVGTGPALYDFANHFQAHANNTELLVFSRNGKLLATRDVSREPNEISQSPDYLQGFQPTDPEDLRNKINTDFAAARLSGERTDRRVALDLMRDLGGHLEKMDLDVVTQFRRSAYFSWIKGAATPIPPESARILESFNPQIKQGRLNGNVSRIVGGGFNIDLDDQQIQADFIINGTGHGRHNSWIIKSLKEQGLTTVNPYLDVLNTDETGYRLTGSGIVVIGPATHFGIDGVESFAQYCEPFAEQFVDRFTAPQQRRAALQATLAATAG